ncbi:MAG: hypothetical protein J6U54_24805 [Clostridiales bacterium]|nr:hypothetical protein [Clostridiales bacterium]
MGWNKKQLRCTPYIDNASFYYSKNYTIEMIISEEVPAYFEGRKRLDEVIGVINSEVGTMVAERN